MLCRFYFLLQSQQVTEDRQCVMKRIIALQTKKRKREQVLPDLPQVRVKCMNKSNGG